jgi:cytidylate kinase
LKLIIAISGFHGTGKSTYAKTLAKEFGLRHISAGMIFRKIAKEKRISLKELSKIAEKNQRIDRMIDEKTKREAKKGNAILEGHLAGWMANDYAGIKIFLTAPNSVRLERIAKREKISLKEARQILYLENAERKRWKKIYKINTEDLSIYDIVLNTGLLPLDSTIKVLKEVVKEYISKHRGK